MTKIGHQTWWAAIIVDVNYRICNCISMGGSLMDETWKRRIRSMGWWWGTAVGMLLIAGIIWLILVRDNPHYFPPH